MNKPQIKVTRPVVPMVYAYSTPEIARHEGWTKIGYTEQDVEERIRQQTHTADIRWALEWKGNALYEDGSGERFTDKDFHAYLRSEGIEQEAGKNNEWFHVGGKESLSMFRDFRETRGRKRGRKKAQPYILRKEQAEAVRQAKEYALGHPQGEFLWNAKPRFGKTLATYDLIRELGAKKALIVTNRPAIANAWYDDYEQFVGDESGYWFVSETEALRHRHGVISRKEYIDISTRSNAKNCIEFVSLQDLKGSIHFGGQMNKLREVADLEWDILVIDEAHEGVDTYRTDIAFERIRRKFTLHLSGTPFKALADAKFEAKAIYNWTYADEQRQKEEWDERQETENPYATLPRLNLYSYRMSEIIRDELRQGIEIGGETEEYAFDLNEFFATQGNGQFKHGSSIDKFLDALTRQEKYPFSTPALREELKHTFWLLNRVDSAKALAVKLQTHPIFKEYDIILAAGDGKLDDNEATQKSYDKVLESISQHEKTITLSVGQLTTGVTIPEWTAVLMLSNVKSPALYMQAAFRAQNPHIFKEGSIYKRKENAYVFDFDPARTLCKYEEFANDLSPHTAAGSGATEQRKKNIRELLNFFPVIGEDEDGTLIELDEEKVLSIPRKIKSTEVVRRGFISNYLFQNISNVFGAPKEVLDIINSFQPITEPKSAAPLREEDVEQLSLDDSGDIVFGEEIVNNRCDEIFGKKIYNEQMVIDALPKEEETQSDKSMQNFKDTVNAMIVDRTLDSIQQSYEGDFKTNDRKKIEKHLKHKAEQTINKLEAHHKINSNVIEQNRTKALQNRFETGQTSEEINRDFDKQQENARQEFLQELTGAIRDLDESFKKEAVETVETNIREKKKACIENDIRDHLRGFSRTIPSFLMAYGHDDVTLASFDTIIPDAVFREVTSISLEQFRFLRDGGDYKDKDTQEIKHFEGKLFDPVVFDDSVREFLALKKRLADYFDEQSVEDIFDYIPPQKTNQIFTPKKVVKKMVDMLEEENPGCFDNPHRTFIDLYMKSGLYITEIVKRLYNSESMKERFPERKERLQHIFEKQVFGLAPTEIIYKIATNYILGFEEEGLRIHHNFRHFDALPHAKNGTLEEELEKLFTTQ